MICIHSHFYTHSSYSYLSIITSHNVKDYKNIIRDRQIWFYLQYSWSVSIIVASFYSLFRVLAFRTSTIHIISSAHPGIFTSSVPRVLAFIFMTISASISLIGHTHPIITFSSILLSISASDSIILFAHNMLSIVSSFASLRLSYFSLQSFIFCWLRHSLPLIINFVSYYLKFGSSLLIMQYKQIVNFSHSTANAVYL